MPEINFNSVNRVYLGNQSAKRVYVGNTLVWKEARKVTDRLISFHFFHTTQKRIYVSLSALTFVRLKLQPSDVTHYVGKSGRWYPVTFTNYNSTPVDIPQEEMHLATDNHTFVLKD